MRLSEIAIHFQMQITGNFSGKKGSLKAVVYRDVETNLKFSKELS